VPRPHPKQGWWKACAKVLGIQIPPSLLAGGQGDLMMRRRDLVWMKGI